MTSYLKVVWHHCSSDEPVLLYSELDADGYETRKVQIYRDGRAEWADASHESGAVGLGTVPVGDLEEMAAQDEFTPTVIGADEFEGQWCAARLGVPVRDLRCRVCGLLQEDPPWGADGRTPSWDICACCGSEFGYEDALPAGVLRARNAWIARGCPWFDESKRPPGWRMEDQLGEGLFEVPSSELEAIADRARVRGIPVYVLATGEGGGRDAFCDTVRGSLPLDPPLQSSNWDALSDSLWQGLYMLPAGEIVIVWPDAAAYRAADAASFEVAHSILKDIAESLADPRPTVGATKKVAVYVAWD